MIETEAEGQLLRNSLRLKVKPPSCLDKYVLWNDVPLLLISYPGNFYFLDGFDGSLDINQNLNARDTPCAHIWTFDIILRVSIGYHGKCHL